MLYLWDATDYGTPTNMDEVFKTFNQLIEKPERPSSAILAFAQRIQDLARFHQVFQEPTKQLYHNLVAQFKQHQYALHSLELPYGNYLPLLKTLGDTAAAFNLVIYDDQLGVAYLPTKKVLPDNRAIDWLMQKDFLANKTFKNLNEFKDYVQPIMHELMARYGLSFTQIPSHEKPVYIKQLEYGLQYISVGYKQDKEGDYELDGMLYIDVPFVGNIYNKFDLAKGINSTVSMQLLYGLYPSSNDSKLKLKTKEDVTTRLQWFEDGFLKALAIAENIKGLDRLLNGDVNERFKSNIQGRGVYTPRCLIVARLANNPRFEELAISLATPRSPGANQESLPTEWPKLVQYLREDINPETCWQQFAQLQLEEQRREEARLNALQRQFNPQTSEELMSLASQFYDAKTNLTWQQCCVGQQWVDGKVIGNPQLLSWDEVQKILAEAKHGGWRLPTKTELQSLVFTSRIGYITKEGFDFYERKEYFFIDHWISPLDDICIMSVNNVENPKTNDLPYIRTTKYKPNSVLKGYLRLVKSVS